MSKGIPPLHSADVALTQFPSEKSVSVAHLLSRALHRIRSTPPRIITSPKTRRCFHFSNTAICLFFFCIEPRRAAVAVIIRVVPSADSPAPSQAASQPTLTEFFNLDWVNDPGARPEILFLHRENISADDTATMVNKVQNTKEAHVTFPGGRTEEGDEGGLYTGSFPLFTSEIIMFKYPPM